MVTLAEALVLSAWLASGAVAARAAATAMMVVRYFFILLSFSTYSCCKLDLVLRSCASRFEQEHWCILGHRKCLGFSYIHLRLNRNYIHLSTLLPLPRSLNGIREVVFYVFWAGPLAEGRL